MQFTVSQDFPAGLDQLWAAFGRPEYPQRKYLALGAVAVRVGRFAATKKAIDVEVGRDVRVDRSRLPSWQRLLARDHQTLQQRFGMGAVRCPAGCGRAWLSAHRASFGAPSSGSLRSGRS